MAKRNDDDSEKWAASIRGAENAVRILSEIQKGGSVVQEITASRERALKQQRELPRRES